MTNWSILLVMHDAMQRYFPKSLSLEPYSNVTLISYIVKYYELVIAVPL